MTDQTVGPDPAAAGQPAPVVNQPAPEAAPIPSDTVDRVEAGVDDPDIPETPEPEPDLPPEEAAADDGDSDEEDDALPAHGPIVIEYEGEEYEIPAPLKDAFLRQADYTRKTQEVAEQRKAVEADRELVQGMAARQQQSLLEYGQLAAIDIQLAQYENVDWAMAQAQNPQEAQAAYMQFNQLRDARGQIQQNITLKEQQSELEKQQARAKRIEKAKPELQREIPEYTDAYAAQLGQFARDNGFSPAELATVDSDPRYVKILHYAKIGRAVLEQRGKKSTQKAAQPQPEAQPAPQVPTGGRSRPAQGNPDKLSTDAWMKNRSNQLAKKRVR